jgi:hypothetical protein
LRKAKRKCACIAKSILIVRIKPSVPLEASLQNLKREKKNENREYRNVE